MSFVALSNANNRFEIFPAESREMISSWAALGQPARTVHFFCMRNTRVYYAQRLTRQRWPLFFTLAVFLSKNAFSYMEQASFHFIRRPIQQQLGAIDISRMVSTSAAIGTKNRVFSNKITALNQLVNNATHFTNPGDEFAFGAHIRVTIDFGAQMVFHFDPTNPQHIINDAEISAIPVHLQYDPTQPISFAAIMNQVLAQEKQEAEARKHAIIDIHTLSIIYAAVTLSQTRARLPSTNHVYSTVQLRLAVEGEITQEPYDINSRFFTIHIIVPDLLRGIRGVVQVRQIYQILLDSIQESVVAWLLAYEPDFRFLHIGTLRVE